MRRHNWREELCYLVDDVKVLLQRRGGYATEILHQDFDEGPDERKGEQSVDFNA